MASETAGSDVGGQAPGTWPLRPLRMLGLMGETRSLTLGVPSLMEETRSLTLGAPSLMGRHGPQHLEAPSLMEETWSLPLGAPSLTGSYGPQHLEIHRLMEETLFLTTGNFRSEEETQCPPRRGLHLDGGDHPYFSLREKCTL